MIFFQISYGQKIIFDTSGRMISFPKQIVRRSSELYFYVKAPTSLLNNRWGIFKNNLTTNSTYLKNSEVKNEYQCFFGTQYDDYVKNIDGLLENWDDQALCKKDNKIDLTQDDSYNIPFNMYKDEILNRQYEIKIFEGEVLVKTIQLSAIIKKCNDDCFYFASQCIKIKDLECKSCNLNHLDSLRFQLVSYDPSNRTIVDWYKQKSLLLENGINKDDILKAFETLCESTCEEDSIAIKKISKLNNWFINWFWYTNGKIALDPFRQIVDSRKNEIKDSIYYVDKDIAILKEQKNFVESAKMKLAPSDWHIEVFKDLQNKSIVLNDKIQTDSIQKDFLQKEINKSTDLLFRLKTSTVLYEGSVIISRWGHIRPQKQFDASNNFSPIYKNNRKLERVTDLPSNEKPFIVIYNLDSTSSIKLDERRLNFNDQEEFTKLLNDQLSNIDFSSISTTALNSVEGFIGSFIPQHPPDVNDIDKIDIENCKFCTAIKPVLIAIGNDISDGNISFPLDPNFLNSYVSSVPKFKTYLQAMNKWPAPFSDSISIKKIIKKDTTDAVKTFVNIGALRYIQLSAGIAVFHNQIAINSIDTSGNGFKVNSSNKTASAVLGLKLYPLKNYNRDNGLIPRYFLRRFSIFGGFDIVHPLNDFYLGGGYDIVPGLSFIVGNNYYLNTTYQVENNQITNTIKSYKSGGLFYSVTINPILVVQFIKLFFK